MLARRPSGSRRASYVAPGRSCVKLEAIWAAYSARGATEVNRLGLRHSQR